MNPFTILSIEYDAIYGTTNECTSDPNAMKDNQLYINNTEFAEDIADDHWVPLAQEF